MNTKKNSPFAIGGGCVGFAEMSAFPHGGGVAVAAFIGAICVGGGVALGETVGTFFKCVNEPIPDATDLNDKTGKAVAALICGVLGLLAWIFPVVGMPITITGFVLGKAARLSPQRQTALIGMGLSLLGLLLSAGNAYCGAYIKVLAALR